jgi:hypothetical protein
MAPSSGMKIACLAFGSLLWKPGAMQLASGWMPDGPPLPLEFARAADGGELAVVVCEPDAVPLQPTWWTRLAGGSLDVARESLREREQVDRSHPEWIGSVEAHVPARPSRRYPHDEAIAAWARRQGLDAVVWTALPPRIDGHEGRMPSAQEAVAHLERLTGDERAHARDYIRRVPRSIAPPYRIAIEARLGWLPV